MEQLLESINKKMNVIIALLLEKQSSQNVAVPEVEVIKQLNDWGLDSSEIGMILRKTTKQISDQLYKYNKRRK